MDELIAIVVLVPLLILICLLALFVRSAGHRRQLTALRSELDALRREVRSLRANEESLSASGPRGARDQAMPPAGETEPQRAAGGGNPPSDQAAQTPPRTLPAKIEELEFNFADAGDSDAEHISPPPESPLARRWKKRLRPRNPGRPREPRHHAAHAVLSRQARPPWPER